MAIKTYQIGKETQYREIEAEFERQCREQISRANEYELPIVYRLIFGLSTIMLGAGMIMQTLVS